MPERIRLPNSSLRNHGEIVRFSRGPQKVVNRLSTGDAPPAPFRSRRSAGPQPPLFSAACDRAVSRDDGPALLRSTTRHAEPGPVTRGTFEVPPSWVGRPSPTFRQCSSGRIFKSFWCPTGVYGWFWPREVLVKLLISFAISDSSRPPPREALGKTPLSPASSLIISSFINCLRSSMAASANTPQP